jgi:hypothetical protein
MLGRRRRLSVRKSGMLGRCFLGMRMSALPGRLAKNGAGVGDEFHHASPAAKIIDLVPMLLLSGRARRIHGHAADRVDLGCACRP